MYYLRTRQEEEQSLSATIPSSSQVRKSTKKAMDVPAKAFKKSGISTRLGLIATGRFVRIANLTSF